MIEQRRLFILGNTLLADGLVQLLTTNQHVTIIGQAYTFEDVIPYLENDQLDMLVIAGVSGFIEQMTRRLVGNYVNLSILIVYLDKSYMELFSIRRVIASYADLAAAIAVMP